MWDGNAQRMDDYRLPTKIWHWQHNDIYQKLESQRAFGKKVYSRPCLNEIKDQLIRMTAENAMQYKEPEPL